MITNYKLFQHQDTILIPSLGKINYEELLQALDLTTLSERRQRYDSNLSNLSWLKWKWTAIFLFKTRGHCYIITVLKYMRFKYY